MKKETPRIFILSGIVLIIFVPLGLFPMLEEGPTTYGNPNPLPGNWIVAAQNVNKPIHQMTIEELQITSTAMQVEASAMLRADMHDMFGNLKGMGWLAIGLFLALCINQFAFTPRRN